MATLESHNLSLRVRFSGRPFDSIFLPVFFLFFLYLIFGSIWVSWILAYTFDPRHLHGLFVRPVCGYEERVMRAIQSQEAECVGRTARNVTSETRSAHHKPNSKRSKDAIGRSKDPSFPSKERVERSLTIATGKKNKTIAVNIPVCRSKGSLKIV